MAAFLCHHLHKRLPRPLQAKGLLSTMMRTQLSSFSSPIVAFAMLLGAPSAWAAPPTILVVHSYHADQQEHVVEMDQGIDEALAGITYQRQSFYMDTKHHTDEAWKQAAGKKAAEMLTRLRPQVVITMDDNAQQYFAKDYAGQPGPPWFVFSGVNNEPAAYGFPAANVTGVLERPNVLESIELLLKIQPQVRNLLIMADKSETTDPLIVYCKTLNLPVTIVGFAQPRTLEEWQATLEQYRGKIDAVGLYVARTVARSATDPSKVPEQELIRLINEHYHLPTVGFFDSAAESGVLCGVSVSMKEQGLAAGRIARAILGGKRPADFPVQTSDQGRIQLNLATAERLGIQIPYGIIKRAEVVIR